MNESADYLDPQILARVVPLGLRAQRVVEGAMSGLHRSPLHGMSVEFADYREYTPGDDLKRLDWRAYARSNRYYIKRYEEETNFRATLLLDASASMRYGRAAARGEGGFTKFSYAATLAASLAVLCVKQRDAIGLALFDNAERAWLRPSAAQSQLIKILDTLDRSGRRAEQSRGTD
jgi:uncharacterized protein (DUF58 family)